MRVYPLRLNMSRLSAPTSSWKERLIWLQSNALSSSKKRTISRCLIWVARRTIYWVSNVSLFSIWQNRVQWCPNLWVKWNSRRILQIILELIFKFQNNSNSILASSRKDNGFEIKNSLTHNLCSAPYFRFFCESCLSVVPVVSYWQIHRNMVLVDFLKMKAIRPWLNPRKWYAYRAWSLVFCPACWQSIAWQSPTRSNADMASIWFRKK